MSNQEKSIHEFDVNLICEYFASMERQGPGSPEATIKALSFIEKLTEQSKIADIGCGTGGQTMTLAEHTNAHIIGLDLFPDFINLFNANAQKMGLQQRVKGQVGSMEALPFEQESLDVIWSEGAIYNIGFKRGLKEWRNLIKPNGCIAVTEVSWFTEKRPSEIEQFWTDAYPEIDTIANKVKQMQEAGYVPIATFILPESCWIDNFYAPQAEAQRIFLEKHPGNSTARELVDNERREAKLYHQYKDFYGYVFYIGKKVNFLEP